MANCLYLGLRTTGDGIEKTIFRSAAVPTFASHGDRFNAVIGPFRTKRGAEFMRDCGQDNPHCQTVLDAERLAKVATL